LKVSAARQSDAGERAHAKEVELGERFEFGSNWQSFLGVVDVERVAEAEISLKRMLETDDLTALSFLDVGSGSGLFSLAAMRLGASRVHSFDLDPNSVASTRNLHGQYGAAKHWTVEEGSALDSEYLESLGQWDIVYSWGVLHHSGDMYRGLENTVRAVAPRGRIFISIYNDQGLRSRIWRRVKRIYNVLPRSLQRPYVVAVMAPREALSAGLAVATLQPQRYWRSWTRYKRSRGMSRWHDLIDWVGGYPFEVAKPEEIFEFFRARGFSLAKLKTTGGGLGCNEYVFLRVGSS
jgi:2-polyprenyl-6-hydroxyphenyl methylase/3-demethylubiquinone-9 3-methyltransferase